MNVWSSIKEYFSPQRKLNDLPSTISDVTDARPIHGPIDPIDPMEGFTPDSFSMEPYFFPTQHELMDVFEERMNQMMKSFNYQRAKINGREYYYQNQDDNGNYFSYYRYQSGPQIYVNGKKLEQDPETIRQLHQKPENLRDLFIKPEYRDQEVRNGVEEIDFDDIRTRLRDA